MSFIATDYLGRYLPRLLNINELTVESCLTSISTVIGFLVAADIVYNIFFHPLSHVPGPFLAKFSHWHHIRRFLAGTEHLSDRELFKQYGSLVRISPNILMFNNPRWLPLVYHRKADKGASYIFNKLFGVLGVFGHKEHTVARRRLAPSFTGTAMQKLRPLLNDLIDEWIEVLVEQMDADGVLDFNRYSPWLTYDVLGNLCFGESLGFMKERKDMYRLIESFSDDLRLLGLAGRAPNFIEWAERVGIINFVKPSPKDGRGIGVIMRVGDELLQKRLDNPIDRPDILGSLLDAKAPDGSRAIGLDELRRELVLLMAAGNDTTSILILDLCTEVFRRPEVQKRIRDLKMVDDPKGHTEQNYITACIKETMRRTPPLVGSAPRVISPGGLQLGDIFVPEGYQVQGSVHNIQRDAETFGEDYEEWIPERWLPRPGCDTVAERERLLAMDRAMYAWGYGVRICLGKPLAEMEAFIVIQKLLNAFDVETIAEAPEQDLFVLRRHEGMRVRLTRRTLV